MRTFNMTVERLDNGFILNMYAYGEGDDEFVGPAGKTVRKYVVSMEEVTDDIKAFLGVDV